MTRTVHDDDAGHTPRRPDAATDPALAVLAGWVEVCVDLMRADGAAVVVVSARDPGVRRVLYSTGMVATQVADVLHVLGPSYGGEECAGDVRTLTVDDADDRLRWPLSVVELASSGVRWVRTISFDCEPDVIGVLQLHRTEAPREPVSKGTETLVGALVRHIAPDTARALSAHLAHDTDDDLVSMSIGVLAARHRVSSSAASALLRAQSYAAGIPVALHARTIVDSLGH